MTDPNYALLAFALDFNEGIRFEKRGRNLIPVVRISTRNAQAMTYMTAAFGGRFTSSKRSGFLFVRANQQAVEIVRKVRPHLVIDQDIADAVLNWKPPVRKSHGSKTVPCPKCDNLMTEGCLTCVDCYRKNIRCEVLEGKKIVAPRITHLTDPAVLNAGAIPNPWVQLSPTGCVAPRIGQASRVVKERD